MVQENSDDVDDAWIKGSAEGTVSIFGKNPKHRDVRNSLGAMLQVSVIDSITVEEAIELFRSYYTNPVAKETLLQLSNLESGESKDVRNYQVGKKKVKLCTRTCRKSRLVIFR